MKQNTILFLAVLGLSIWFAPRHSGHPSNVKRNLASQMDFSDDENEEEYDFHESVNIKRSKDAKPLIKSKSDKKLQDEKNPPHKGPKKIIDTLEDSEFSGADLHKLINRCEFGDREACHKSGLQLLATDPKSLQATKLLARGCHLKRYTDCEQVGNILKDSHGTSVALPYYTAACEQAGLADSCFEAATITANESESPREQERTRDYFNIACLEGNANGCLSLANFYSSNWPKQKYYLAEACKLDPNLDPQNCQQFVD